MKKRVKALCPQVGVKKVGVKINHKITRKKKKKKKGKYHVSYFPCLKTIVLLWDTWEENG